MHVCTIDRCGKCWGNGAHFYTFPDFLKKARKVMQSPLVVSSPLPLSSNSAEPSHIKQFDSFDPDRRANEIKMHDFPLAKHARTNGFLARCLIR